jgi:5-methylthioadenosine/S-adenosylhomocysteine deaminase
MLLVRNGHVLTMDPALGDVSGADVLIRDGRIAEIGRSVEASGAEVIDATGHVVLPGFVDTHRHVWRSALRGLGGDMSLDRFLTEIVRGAGPRYTAADTRHGSLLGALEAIDAGTTTVFDFVGGLPGPEHDEAALDGIVAAGIRAVHGLTGDDPARTERLAATLTGRITVALAIMGPEYLPFDQGIAPLALARRLGLHTSMHIGGGAHGARARTVARLRDAGLLGPDLLFSHADRIGDDEVKALVDSGAAVAVSPVVESMMGHGEPVFGRFAAAGGAPTFGVDVVISAGEMFDQMRATLWAERRTATGNGLDETPAARDMLRAATIDGARALGLGDVTGSLTPGKRADLIVLGGLTHVVHSAAATGVDVAAAVVTAGTPSDVRDVLVDGEVVKRNGALLQDPRPLREATPAILTRVYTA